MNAKPHGRALLRGRCLIVSESTENDLAEALQAELTSPETRIESVRFADALHVALRGDGSPSHILAILPRTPSPEGDERARLARMVGRLHAIAGLASADGSIVFVQFGGGRFGTGPEPAEPEQCCAAAFARSLHLERPGLRVRVVDLAAALPRERIVAAVLRAMGGDEGFRAAGHDANGARLEPRARLQQPAHYLPRSLNWSADEVIVVTGGAKGITAECALALARRTRTRFALVGSSPVPKPGAENELTETLRRFESEGILCRYYSCNVSDAPAVLELVKQIRSEMGPIAGVVHGAALNRPRRVEQVSAEEALAEVTPKLLGARNLCAALADAPPKLFVGLTSIIGVTGMPGNTWYGFSNEALDLLLRRFEFEHPQTAVISVAFSVWGETGMGARMGSVRHLGKMGIGAIPTAEGVRRFVQLCECDPGQKQVIVTARLAGLDTWPIESPPVPTGLRFVERIVRAHPGVDLVARTRLSLERDLYLQDHNYNGSFLFPTVFGLEAMTQAAAALTGEAEPQVRRMENISLERPIVVDPQDGVEIELRAEMLEETTEGERMVRVGIRTEQTGFASDHFSATLVLGTPLAGDQAKLPLDSEPLAIEPLTDLYGGLLFQGPRFQKMGHIYELDSNHTIFESEVDAPAKLEEKSFASNRGGRLLLGDPFFRDVLLQAGQVTIPREVCLPIRIERIERFASTEAMPRRFVVAPYKVRHGQEYVAEVFATDEQGRVLEKLTGYWLRILEERPDNPTAEELAHPEERDERILHQALERVLPDNETTVALAHMPGLHALPRPERRQREQPLIDKVLRNHLNMDTATACDFHVSWLPSGKPQFEQAPQANLDLSIAHDDRTCLCVVGTGPQGCDLTPIAPRSREDWRALLGDARMALMEELMRGSDSLDQAGARVWAGVEAIRKATQAPEVRLVVDRRQAEGVFLRAPDLPGSPRVLTLPVRWTLGPERMIALVLPAAPEAAPAAPLTRGIPSDWHCVSVAEDGPQGQPVQQLRFVVSFQEASSISRHVPVSRYLVWMGKMRELVMSGSVPQLVEQIATGEWGLVTNWGDVHVFGEATANDVIQMRFWTNHANGSEVEFFCDFWKVHANGHMERVAFGEQKATWVRLVGHGQVVPEPIPDYLKDFIASMGPREHNARTLPTVSETLTGLDLGAVVEEVPSGPSGGRVLATETVQTTLEESNLVGNVYFANYFAWQSRVRDLFLHRIAPEYFRGIGSDGEMVCLRSRVDYLREAMPFERIQIVLTVRSIRERGAVLGFEYYRLEPDGRRQKLSVGTHEVAWVRRGADGIPQTAPLPAAIRAAFQAMAKEETSTPLHTAANRILSAARHNQRKVG